MKQQAAANDMNNTIVGDLILLIVFDFTGTISY